MFGGGRGVLVGGVIGVGGWESAQRIATADAGQLHCPGQLRGGTGDSRRSLGSGRAVQRTRQRPPLGETKTGRRHCCQPRCHADGRPSRPAATVTQAQTVVQERTATHRSRNPDGSEDRHAHNHRDQPDT